MLKLLEIKTCKGNLKMVLAQKSLGMKPKNKWIYECKLFVNDLVIEDFGW